MAMKNCLIIISLFFLFGANLAAQEEVGMASYYSNRYHGTRTYSGERYNKNALTCAHKTYPIGTKLKVTRLSNDKSVVVRVNDRMSSNRNVIDLSRAAASKLGMLSAGTVKVKVELFQEDEVPLTKLNDANNEQPPKAEDSGKGQNPH